MTMLARFILALALGLLPTVARGHAPRAEPGLVVQIDDDGFAALWTLTVRGRDAALLWAIHDLDHDGRLSDLEHHRLAAALAAKAIAGVELSWNGAPLSVHVVDARLADPTQSRELRLLALTTLRGERAEAPTAGSLGVVVAARRGALQVQVQTLGGRRVEQSTAGGVAADARGLRESVVLAPGGRVEVHVAREGRPLQ